MSDYHFAPACITSVVLLACVTSVTDLVNGGPAQTAWNPNLHDAEYAAIGIERVQERFLPSSPTERLSLTI